MTYHPAAACKQAACLLWNSPDYAEAWAAYKQHVQVCATCRKALAEMQAEGKGKDDK